VRRPFERRSQISRRVQSATELRNAKIPQIGSLLIDKRRKTCEKGRISNNARTHLPTIGRSPSLFNERESASACTSAGAPFAGNNWAFHTSNQSQLPLRLTHYRHSGAVIDWGTNAQLWEDLATTQSLMMPIWRPSVATKGVAPDRVPPNLPARDGGTRPGPQHRSGTFQQPRRNTVHSAEMS
jgi:hypothetical protein